MASRFPLTNGDPSEIRRSVCDTLRTAADADVCGYYAVADLDGDPVLTNLCVRGNHLAASVESVMRRPDFMSPFLDWKRPPAIQTQAFLESDALFGAGVLQRSEFFQNTLGPIGIGDQVRLLVYDGDDFVGLIAALRRDGGKTSRFTARDRARLAPLVTGAADALVTAHRLGRSVPARECFLVARPDGHIELVGPDPSYATHHADLLARVSEEVRRLGAGRRDAPDRILAGFRCRILPLEGGDLRYLVTLSLAPTVRHAPDRILTETERRVCALAAAGATVAEIARDQGRTPNTVRTHLRRAYAKLGVASRVELVRALES